MAKDPENWIVLDGLSGFDWVWLGLVGFGWLGGFGVFASLIWVLQLVIVLFVFVWLLAGGFLCFVFVCWFCEMG